MGNSVKKILVLLLVFIWFLTGWPQIWQNPRIPPVIQPVYAATVTAANATTISADTNSNNGTGAYTALTGPVIIEAAVGDVGTGTIILSAPSGFAFDTGTNVTLTVTNGSCSGGGNGPVKLGAGAGASSETVTPAADTITNNVKTASKGASGCISTLTYTNIKVRPTNAGSTLSSGNITKSSSSTSTISGVTNGSTNFGTLTEVAGAKNTLAVTTQPSSTATVNTAFGTKPVVTLQDQYGNTETTDSSSTVTEAVVLSTQTCGGTAGSGSLTSTPTSGSAVSSGIMTYTAMQYSAVESIKICFSSSGVTSALSNAVNVITLPTVSTSNATSVKDTTATGNGDITNTGGENNDKQGFVYDTSTKSLPGNVAPGSSGYASSTENTGSYGTGTFIVSLTGLSGGTTYYGRAYSHNSAGYSYGGEVNFSTAVISISITSNGVISYGFVAPSTSKNTTASDLNNTQTAQNDSIIAEDFNIKTTNATGGTQWTLGSSAGSDVFVHEFSTNSGGAWTKFTTADSYQTLATSITASGTQNFDLRITAPTSSSDYQQKSITITVQAVAQ